MGGFWIGDITDGREHLNIFVQFKLLLFSVNIGVTNKF